MSKITNFIGENPQYKTITKRVNGIPVVIKTYFDVDTIASIVQVVAQTSFQDDGYHAENREIATRFAILKYLTDVEVDDADINDIFVQTQVGNWYAQIETEITKLSLWGVVDSAIDKQIDYLIATRQTAFDKLCADLSAILSVDTKADLADVKEVLEKLDKVDKQEFVEAVVEQSVKKTKKK